MAKDKAVWYVTCERGGSPFPGVLAMIIDSLSNTTQTRRRQDGSQAESAASFQEALARLSKTAAAGGTTKSEAATAAAVEAKKVDADKAETAQLQNALQEYLSKSAAEHMRDAILKEMGITEEELAAKPPEERMALETEITRRIKERMVGKQEGDSEEATLKAIEALYRHAKTTDDSSATGKSAGLVSATVIADLMAQTTGKLSA